MNKNIIMKDFLDLKEKGVIIDDFSDFEELLDILSQMFSDEYKSSSDAQEAFNSLNCKLEDMLNKHCGVYTLGTEDWTISYDSKASQETIKEAIQDWNDYCEDKVKDIDDLCDSLSCVVSKDMSNCGCDAYNALEMICDDIFSGSQLFFVSLGELNPRISFLDINLYK